MHKIDGRQFKKVVITGTCNDPDEAQIKTVSYEELKNYLTSSFPEIVCEALKNKYDSSLARFKITINYENLEKSRKPSIWLNGAQVTRSFHPRRISNTTN